MAQWHRVGGKAVPRRCYNAGLLKCTLHGSCHSLVAVHNVLRADLCHILGTTRVLLTINTPEGLVVDVKFQKLSSMCYQKSDWCSECAY